MTPQRLLELALTSSTADESGLRELAAHAANAEKPLNAARVAVAECEAYENKLIDQQAAINAKLATLSREIQTLQSANARAVLEALSQKSKRADVAGVLSTCAATRRSLGDQARVLSETLNHIVTELLPVAAIRKTEAAIELAKASRDWVTCRSFEDLMRLQLEIAPALRHDPALTLNVGDGSHAHAFAQKLNSFDIELANLEARLERETSVAQKYLMEAA